MARKSREGKQVTSGADRGASALGALASRKAAAGSDEMREGMKSFLEEVHRRAKMGPGQAKGFYFEQIEAAKFNTDAASKGFAKRALVRGDNHPSVDLVVKEGGSIKGEYQLKAGESANKKLEDPRYDNVRRVTTKGDADPQRRVEDETTHGTVSSGGTTQDELRRATKYPKMYAGIQETKQVVREAAVAGGHAAAMGAVMGFATSAPRNVFAWVKEGKDGKEAAKEIAKDTARSSVRSGAVAAGSAAVRHVGHKIGAKALTKTNVAAAVASALVDVGATVRSLVKGEISAEDAAIRLGDTGCGALSGLYVGATAGAIFGPVGAAVGSTVGYLLSACVYQSCVATFQKARLAEEETERVVALCAEAVRRMDEQRRKFEHDAATWLAARRDAFDSHFNRIDAALAGGDPEKAAKSLSRFARSFGKKLRHADFEDFQAFMDSKDPVVL